MTTTLIIGAPSSGKTTLRDNIKTNNDIILNRDTEGGTIADLLPKLEKCLQEKQNVILDNLFPTIESRKPFIDLCKSYDTNINCIYVDTSIEDAQFNFVSRMIKKYGKFLSMEEIKKSKDPGLFPPVVFFKYKKEFQKPTLNEGFSNLEVFHFERKDDTSFTNKALICDFDGTLRECVGGNGKYPTEFDHIEINKNAIKTLLHFKENGYLLLGVSNQSGISKKELTNEKCIELFDYTNKQLGFDIDYSFCPHQSAPVSCYCRKPQTGLFVDFMFKYKLNRKECLMVGDLKTDETFSNRSGLQFVYANEFFK